MTEKPEIDDQLARLRAENARLRVENDRLWMVAENRPIPKRLVDLEDEDEVDGLRDKNDRLLADIDLARKQGQAEMCASLERGVQEDSGGLWPDWVYRVREIRSDRDRFAAALRSISAAAGPIRWHWRPGSSPLSPEAVTIDSRLIVEARELIGEEPVVAAVPDDDVDTIGELYGEERFDQL